MQHTWEVNGLKIRNILIRQEFLNRNAPCALAVTVIIAVVWIAHAVVEPISSYSQWTKGPRVFMASPAR